MLWEDERWVRVYTRETVDWIALGYEAQSLFMHLLKHADRAGLIHLGKHGVRGLAAMLRAPLEPIQGALQVLLDDGCVELRSTSLVIRNFIQAQEAKSSDAQRQRDHRERVRDVARAEELGFLESSAGQSVTERDSQSQNVTNPPGVGHAPSQPVTPSYPSVPSVPSGGRAPAPAPARESTPSPRPTPAASPPPLGDLDIRVQAAFREVRGCDMAELPMKDKRALGDVLFAKAKGDERELLRRWRLGLVRAVYPRCTSVHDLLKHWDEYGSDPPRLKPATDVRRGTIRAEDQHHGPEVGEMDARELLA